MEGKRCCIKKYQELLFLQPYYYCFHSLQLFFFKYDMIQTERVFVASGLVSGKFESDYSCGSKMRYVCYARYLIIEGDKYLVNHETFTKNQVGNKVYLTKLETKIINGKILPFFIIGALFICAFIFSLVFLFFTFVHWSITSSDRVGFIEYVKDL